jgi:hypothetical protein
MRSRQKGIRLRDMPIPCTLYHAHIVPPQVEANSVVLDFSHLGVGV